MPPQGAQKRKQPNASHNEPGAKRPRFQQRPQHVIAAQPTESAYPNGELNVARFLHTHQNEIKSLETAMAAAKKGLSRRAFQEVPREMRRRTASHNPQRVPKRMRDRARREAREDNTPTSKGKSGSGIGKGRVKWLRREGMEKSRQAWEERARRRKEKGAAEAKEDNPDVEMRDADSPKPAQKTTKKRSRFPSLATPDMPSSRFRRRQIDKTWLPTHIWHTKRAKMTPPKEPLWRFAIPLEPALKAYRLTHRATALRGAVAWDMSYMSTISLEGAETSIAGLLKALHFGEEGDQNPWQERGLGKQWKNGTRVWEGWLCAREKTWSDKIAPVTVIWSVAAPESQSRKAFIRVHPTAFLQLWNELVRAAKVQKPAVKVEDLRFEIGSIEIMGPASAEALCSALRPSPSSNSAPDCPASLWPSLAAVTDVATLPKSALLAFAISDPRLRDPPEATKIPQDGASLSRLIELLAQWPADKTQDTSTIFNRNSRLAASRSLPSQKSINRRKSASTPGKPPEPRSTDPQIPMLLYASKANRSWNALLPWKCVLPVWRGIMRYPVSTGGNPRFGGLKERRQVNFERSTPTFPFDHPGSDAGWAWELKQREARQQEWTKRPKGKRIEWTMIDLGNGRKGEIGDPWACEWERVLPKPPQQTVAAATDSSGTACSPFRQMAAQQAVAAMAERPPRADHLTMPHLFTAKITMVQRGHATDCARIYRLPSNNPDVLEKWLSLMSPAKASTPNRAPGQKRSKSSGPSLPKHARNKELAQRLLDRPVSGGGPPKPGDADYPVVPDEEDLVGFVTTGNYNLAEGIPTAVASLALHKVLEVAGGSKEDKHGRVCIVREAGYTVGRLARWEVV